MDPARAIEAVHEILHCSVCTEAYQTSGPLTPKMLPCQHTFCLNCITSIREEQEITCPLCRKSCSSDLDQLQTNILMLSLIDKAGLPDDAEKEMTEDEIMKTLSDEDQQEDEVLNALRSLRRLINCDKSYNEEYFMIVTDVMSRTSAASDIELVKMATECIYVLRNLDVENKISQNAMTKVTAETLKVMNNYSDNKEVLVNCLRYLCNDWILNEATFDNLEMAKCMMSLLSGGDDNQLIKRMSNAILSVLVRNFSEEERVLFGNKPNVKILLELIEKKLDDSTLDMELSFTLTTLSSLTDEVPITSLSIIDNEGLNILERVLKQEKIAVTLANLTLTGLLELQLHLNACHSTALCVLGNISDVPGLRRHLLNPGGTLVKTIEKYLDSEEFNISCFAGQVIANLGILKSDEWRRLTGKWFLRRQVLGHVYKRVLSLKEPQEVFVAFKTLRTLYTFLQQTDTPSTQVYAAWMIRALCRLDGTKYKEMITSEGGVEHFVQVLETPRLDKNVKQIIIEILATVHPDRKGFS